jgi:hypothetical protein
MLAHEISSMPDMVIERLRRRRSGIGQRPKFDAIARLRDRPIAPQAARTVSRNLPTLSLRRLLSPDND